MKSCISLLVKKVLLNNFEKNKQMVKLKVYCKRFAFLSAGYERESLSLDCDTGPLNALLDVPVNKRAFTLVKKKLI